MTPKRGQLVEIHWHDSSSGDLGWATVERYLEWAKSQHGECRIRTVGYMLHRCKRSITVVHSWTADGHVDRAMQIPLGLVISCRVLKSRSK
jgi:hypothetical protein